MSTNTNHDSELPPPAMIKQKYDYKVLGVVVLLTLWAIPVLGMSAPTVLVQISEQGAGPAHTFRQ